MNDLPEFFSVRQNFPSHCINDLNAAVVAALEEANLSTMIRPGQRVAIAVGSRGIANLSEVVATVVAVVRQLGAQPMIVPAMGSHGGATPEGQIAVLNSLGIDSATMNCEIESSMETVQVGVADDVEIYFDRISSEADHVILINRIKPHTRLIGKIESGLSKMLMIGLGKHRGASRYHQIFQDYDHDLYRIARHVVPMISQQMPITVGLAIVEDAFDEVSLVQAVLPDDFLETEPELLKLAASRMPALPFAEADLLIVDQIGKEISGTGMDTNVIGRKANDKAAAPDETPKVRHLYVRNLTAKTAGNASGIGIAEFCRTSVVRAMDIEVTRINCLTSCHVSAAAIPVHFETDREVLEAAVSQGGSKSPEQLKWLWIRDTLQLSNVLCSQAYWAAANERSDLNLVGAPSPLRFDSTGNLVDFDSQGLVVKTD